MPSAESLLDLLHHLGEGNLPLQLAALGVSLGLAWAGAHLLRPKILDSRAWRIGTASARRLIFPLTALALVALFRSALKQQSALLDIAVPILIALAVIRVVVYMLRASFARNLTSSWEKAVTWVVWGIFALHISGLLPDALDLFDSIGFSIGKQRISLLIMLQGILILAFSLLASLWASRYLEKRIMGTEVMDMNLRVMFSKVSRTLLIVIGALAGLSAAGIDMTLLSMFGGAFGVGLGLGLQKIASNYVSGFIILLDRSIHIGDIVSADNRTGVVKQLTTRYIVLQSTDGSESLIPNDTLVTSTVINHSYSDRVVRVAVPVAVSYGASLETAMQLMLEAGKNQPRVLADPEPQVYLKSFGESAVNLELGIWISDPENGQLGLVSAINLEILQNFRQNGIEFPQREVRLLQSPHPL